VVSLVNVESSEAPQCTPEQAREITERIKVGVEAVWHLIVQAYQGGAHRALGYSSWDDYCTREFGTSRIRLPREERQEVVASLRESGLSTRAISVVAGVDDRTVRRDIDAIEAGAANAAPDRRGTEVEPRFKESMKVKGTDGKSYEPNKPGWAERVKAATKNNPVQPTRAQRVIDIRQLAERGNNAQQIANQIGVQRRYVMELAIAERITLPDHIVGKVHKLDHNRMVRETVTAVDGAAFGLNLIDLEQVDPDELEGWVISLGDSLKSLNSFHRKMKEMTR
jgi:hypothetical protein